MAGVNLLQQIRKDEVVEKNAIVSGGGILSEVTASDKIRILLFVGAGLAFYFARGYVNDTYLPAKLVAPQKELADMDTKLAEINRKKASLADLEKELKDNETRIQEIEAKIQQINDIKNSNRDKVVRILDYIVNQMPEPIWITEVSAKSKKGDEIDLKGYSMNHQTISEFFKKLESGAFFSNWQLVEATREKVKQGDKDIDATRFELKSQVSEAR